MKRHLANALVLLTTLVAGMAACSAQAGRIEVKFPTPTIDWAGCGPELECASVEVPLDWADRGGPTVELAVIRHVASRPNSRIGSLFINPGGPGESGVNDVAENGEFLDTLTMGRFDVVGWDIRGSGDSAAVQCFPSDLERAALWSNQPIPITRPDEQRYLVKTIEFARSCGEQNDGLLAHISTADTVRDLDYLRRLVGDRGLTFRGVSGGTLIGQTYANMFPKRVRAMVLDGLIDPIAFTAGTASGLASGLADTDEVFGRFLALCQRAGPALCELAGHGHVRSRVKLLLRRLREHPIPAPDAPIAGALTYAETLSAIEAGYLANPRLWPQLASMLEEAAAGDGSGLKAVAEAVASQEFHKAFEPTQALICADSPSRQDAVEWPRVVDRLRHVSQIGGPFLGWLVGAPCASWTMSSQAPYRGPWGAVTRNPILLIGTRFDPNTPFANARRAEGRLGHAILLTHDGYGHTSDTDPSECVFTAVRSYLVKLTVPARGTECSPDRIPFDPAFGEPLP
jgi:pimeloyl-ACP methyl ester carboxylesterase